MELDNKTIQKYSKFTTAKLKVKAQIVFNKWIRTRDAGNSCISCPSYNTSDASHLYSAGKHNHMRFNPDNVHLACKRCNLFLSGNLLEYRKRLIKKIGLERVEKLDLLAADKGVHKDNRFLYIEVCESYKLK